MHLTDEDQFRLDQIRFVEYKMGHGDSLTNSNKFCSRAQMNHTSFLFAQLAKERSDSLKHCCGKWLNVSAYIFNFVYNGEQRHLILYPFRQVLSPQSASLYLWTEVLYTNSTDLLSQCFSVPVLVQGFRTVHNIQVSLFPTHLSIIW